MWQPPDPSFNAKVWEIVREVPAGVVTTYGQIASMIPPPEDYPLDQYLRLSPRWVGQAMNACPDDVPWQRVINSQGRISFPAGSMTGERQRMLLEGEGVHFDEGGRVDFDQVGWEGPPPEWLETHGLLPPRSLRRSSGSQHGQMSLF